MDKLAQPISGEVTRISYVKSVISTGFHTDVTLEDTCPGHKWRHRSSKWFKRPLPDDWIYCPRCGTEKLETVD